MAFSGEVKIQAMVACGRCCCICHKFCGNNMEVHHIRPHADGGQDTFENAIPLYFDCHAEVGQYDSRHPKGVRFTEKELIQHRDNWYQKIKGEKKEHERVRETDSIKISHKEELEILMLHRVLSGKELMGYIYDIYAVENDYDEPDNEEELDIICRFLGRIQEIIDIEDELELSEKVRCAYELNMNLKELYDVGYMVFVEREVRQISGGGKPKEDFPVLVVRILKKSNAGIMKI